MDDRTGVQAPCGIVESAQKTGVSPIHKIAPIGDRTPYLVTKMSPRMVPIPLDPLLAEQRNRYVAMWHSGLPTVERSNNTDQARRATFTRIQGRSQLAAGDDVRKTLDRQQPARRECAGRQCRRDKGSRFQFFWPRHFQLEGAAFLGEEHMPVFALDVDCDAACHAVQCKPPPCAIVWQLDRGQRQDRRASTPAPHDVRGTRIKSRVFEDAP